VSGAPAVQNDVLDVVAFLASDAARWITGASIPVDGGSRASKWPIENPTKKQVPCIVLEEVEAHESGYCSWRQIS
jgi:Enoyl-(Acyl carrier protein) reductase